MKDVNGLLVGVLSYSFFSVRFWFLLLLLHFFVCLLGLILVLGIFCLIFVFFFYPTSPGSSGQGSVTVSDICLWHSEGAQGDLA